MPPCKSCSERYDINQRLKYIKDILYPQHRINVRHAFTAKSQVSSGDVQKRRDWLKWLAEMVEVLNHWRKTPFIICFQTLHTCTNSMTSAVYIYIYMYIYINIGLGFAPGVTMSRPTLTMLYVKPQLLSLCLIRIRR